MGTRGGTELGVASGRDVALGLRVIDDIRSRETLRRLAVWHVAGSLLALPLAGSSDAPERVLLLGVLAVAIVAGTVTLVLLRRQLSAPRFARLDCTVFWLDLGLLSLATVSAASGPIALLLIPVLSTLRMARRGAILGVTIAALAEGMRQVVIVLLRGDPSTPFRSLELLVIAAVIAGVISQLTTRLDERRIDAERVAADARASQQQVRSLHRIVMAGIGGSEHSVIERVIHEVHVEYGYSGVSFALHERGRLEFVGMAGATYPFEDVPIDADGPAARVLAGSDAVQVTGADLDLVETSLADITSLIVAPVRGRHDLLGLLIVESDDTGPRPAGEASTIQRLADQIGVLMEAARAFDREAGLAADYRRLDEMRRDFVSLTSHELRTPATAIVGFVETLLERDIDPATRRTLLEATSRQATRLTRLIDDLRTVSVMDAGGMKVVAVTSPLDDVIRSVEEIFDADVAFRSPAGVAVLADPSRLVQVLTNLVENALRHGAEPVTVSWHTSGDRLTLCVCDQGKGVPDDRRERIFERFETTSDLLAHHRGSGLGLSIARELAERMGGGLELVAAERGACFELTVPLAGVSSTPEHLPSIV